MDSPDFGADDTPIRPVSCRFLIPEIEDAIALDGQIIDYLYLCYRTSITINGIKIPCEYYFTNCTTGVRHNYQIPTPWDLPWSDRFKPNDPCRDYDYQPTDGTTPCAYTCGQKQPHPIPETITQPTIILDDHNTTLAAETQNDQNDPLDIWHY